MNFHCAWMIPAKTMAGFVGGPGEGLGPGEGGGTPLGNASTHSFVASSLLALATADVAESWRDVCK